MACPPTIEEKEAFYAQLGLLDAPSDEGEEDCKAESELRAQSRAFFKQGKATARKSSQSRNATPSASIYRAETSTQRTNTVPTPARDRDSSIVEATPAVSGKSGHTSRQGGLVDTSFVEDTPVQHLRSSEIAGLRRSVTDPVSLPSFVNTSFEQPPSVMANGRKHPTQAKGKAKAKAKGKGKGKEEEAVPEGEKILSGLRFFYIPSGRIGLRKQQMMRAERFGAVVTQEVSNATHIIVDQQLRYDHIKSEVETLLRQDKPPIVNDQYPLECIIEKRILPAYPRFRVKGLPTDKTPAPTPREEPTSSRISDNPLQLKTPNKDQSKRDTQQTTAQSEAFLTPILGKRQEPTTADAEQFSVQDFDRGLITVASSLAPSGEIGCDEAQHISKKPRRKDSVIQDELQHIITEVREDYKDLPSIGDDDAMLKPEKLSREQDSGSEDGEEDEEPRDPNFKWEDHFACSKGGTKDQALDKNNPNFQVLVKFQKLSEYYTRTNDHWRIRAYRIAINNLSRVQVRVTTEKEAKKIPGFGRSLASKLEEIVKTDTLKRLEYAENDPVGRVQALFLGIYGVGNATADNWIAKGYKTLDDLLQKAPLTPSQRVGIEHYDDLNSRIPRAEVTKLGDFVKEEATRIDDGVELLIGGSYRRGADSSGDIDFIITKKGTNSTDQLTLFLNRLVASLSRKGFLTAELTSHTPHRHHRDDSGSKWHGCCVLPRIPGWTNDNDDYRPVWRRIDILLVPETQYGAALIYFTGNDIFNRSIRLLASKKDMRLNQRGLYGNVRRGLDREKICEGDLLEGRSERRIFELLNVEWRPPKDRCC